MHASEIMFLIQLAEQYSRSFRIISISELESSYSIVLKFFRSNCLRASQSGLPIYINLLNRRFAAVSSYFGRLVAPITRTSPPFGLFIPSIRTRNSVFSLLDAQFYAQLLAVSIESISSIKMIDGAIFKAASNIFLIVFQDYPTYLLRTEEAESAKKVQFDSLANALQMYVLPFPGGPQSKSPFGGALIPTQRSGLFLGLMTASYNIDLAYQRPAMSQKETSKFLIINSSTSWSITIFFFNDLFNLGTPWLFYQHFLTLCILGFLFVYFFINLVFSNLSNGLFPYYYQLITLFYSLKEPPQFLMSFSLDFRVGSSIKLLK